MDELINRKVTSSCDPH